MVQGQNSMAESGATAAIFAANNTNFIAALRQQMMGYAASCLSDPQGAEDAVQDAFIAAMKGADTFRGKAAFKTWVFAILRNKIADQLRQRRRVADREQLDDVEGSVDEFFDRSGHWLGAAKPAPWSDPESAGNNADFWRVFQHCMDDMPPKQAQAFMMREMLQQESASICEELGITLSNLNVSLHRGRLRLRDCLEQCWFEGDSHAELP
ncbi:RNA polymerase sigma-70 factor, TIGR02943 family [Luminiphilus syltensis NOR5-1B]|uniref:RNA polymerase sigma-70 factor, TIGR02943 family n=1 Tax=Luminiphilus syltensis NOR5-1B TaxID=565045 RepID=B8KWN4_9GAMM|nr:sigma-70 family RNA polymerase sigma factor [Luminiphilus syltensis]EED36228.1 RNA polymerase sigma-70 factor, TIGR02943 family [Luminiphilus syltensis NOR5-1B]